MKEPEWIRAEKQVAELLEQLLPEGYLIFNDVRFKYGNIDHLVIRPDGVVFLVETKSHKGLVTTDGKRLLLNGQPFKKNYLCQMNCNIRWLRNMAKKAFRLNRWYVAIIVFPDAEVLIKRSVRRVNVMGVKNLLLYIRTYQKRSSQGPSRD
jgi:hypothetical protein